MSAVPIFKAGAGPRFPGTRAHASCGVLLKKSSLPCVSTTFGTGSRPPKLPSPLQNDDGNSPADSRSLLGTKFGSSEFVETHHPLAADINC
jgi:hypothetical protein